MRNSTTKRRDRHSKPPVGTPPRSKTGEGSDPPQSPLSKGGGQSETGLCPAQVVVVSLAVRPVDLSANVGRHVDVQLDRRQRLALRALFNAQHHDQAAKLSNGRYVQSVQDSVRCLLEQVADAIEAASGKPIDQFVV